MAHYVNASHVLNIQTEFKKLELIIKDFAREAPSFNNEMHHAHLLGAALANLQFTIANGESYSRDSDYVKDDCHVCYPTSKAQLSFEFMK